MMRSKWLTPFSTTLAIIGKLPIIPSFIPQVFLAWLFSLPRLFKKYYWFQMYGFLHLWRAVLKLKPVCSWRWIIGLRVRRAKMSEHFRVILTWIRPRREVNAANVGSQMCYLTFFSQVWGWYASGDVLCISQTVIDGAGIKYHDRRGVLPWRDNWNWTF